MLNINFLEKGLVLVSSPHFVYDFSRKFFSCYILSTDQISFSDCLYFSRYWVICVLQSLVNQAVTRKMDSDLIRENAGYRRPDFWQILRNVVDINFNFLPRFQDKFLSFAEKTSMTVTRHKSAGTQRPEHDP